MYTVCVKTQFSVHFIVCFSILLENEFPQRLNCLFINESVSVLCYPFTVLNVSTFARSFNSEVSDEITTAMFVFAVY